MKPLSLPGEKRQQRLTLKERSVKAPPPPGREGTACAPLARVRWSARAASAGWGAGFG
ncbi:hypothetical protein XMIN_270 [Xanthomonas citri pv. mangiferaeindicae LMG 941]|nr:hypothetical protein XMIN_270 [Xanthomonas citri pv. mangiferaeindicae LMG 941]